MHFYQLKTIFLVIVLASSIGAQQNSSGSLSSKKSQLQDIRDEIEKYKHEIEKKQHKESTAIDMLAALDREVDVTSSLVRNLSKAIKRYERQISGREKQIADTEKQLERLKKKFAQRLVAFYKHGRVNDFQLLMNVQSFHQARVWLSYAKRVAENDRRTFENISKKKKQLERNRNLLQLEIVEKQRAIESKSAEQRRLKQSKKERQHYLNSLRKDKEFLKKKLAEKERAAQQIGRLIIEAENQRVRRDKPVVASSGVAFSSLKGKMLWPAKGSIVSHFGKQKHPELKTITENLGIEIRAPYGSPVRVVDDGEVWTITWQRGRGNIVIVSHDDGYYTVYTHLAEIQVELHEYVSQGQVIGTVGDSGSLNGAVLHFQIWKNTNNLNPEQWLS